MSLCWAFCCWPAAGGGLWGPELCCVAGATGRTGSREVQVRFVRVVAVEVLRIFWPGSGGLPCSMLSDFG